MRLKLVMQQIFFLLLCVLYANGLRCYQCMSFSCPESPMLCSSVRQFIFSQLPQLYYGFEKGIDSCPEDKDVQSLSWESLRQSSNIDCPEIEKGEATCTVGRIQVVTHITDLKTNVTSHATVLGCAKRKILESTKRAARQSNRCSLLENLSPIRNSLKHYLQIEHCSQITDMCHQHDFCIHPVNSIVRNFVKSYNTSSSIWWVVLALSILGLFIMVMTFAGIKFD